MACIQLVLMHRAVVLPWLLGDEWCRATFFLIQPVLGAFAVKKLGSFLVGFEA